MPADPLPHFRMMKGSRRNIVQAAFFGVFKPVVLPALGESWIKTDASTIAENASRTFGKGFRYAIAAPKQEREKE